MTAVPTTSGTVESHAVPALFHAIPPKAHPNPTPDPGDDLTSALVLTHEAGDQLSEDELIGMISLLLIAGHETTVNLIGNGMLALMEHPDSMEQLRHDPSLIKSAIEELLRMMVRWRRQPNDLCEDVTIHGVTIPRGEMVFAVLASANRDERRFERPDELDLSREPNRHVAFGLGVHYCMGAPLARLEGKSPSTPSYVEFPSSDCPCR